MLVRRYLLLPAALIALAAHAHAQPSDAQIKKDITGKGAIKATLHGRGVRSWSSTWKQYFWERSATVLRKANIPEYPAATVEVTGVARYTLIGGGYKYREFAVTGNRYYGLPAPSKGEVLILINSDLPKFLGHHYYKIVGDLAPISHLDKPEYFWHTPNSVSLSLKTTFEEPVSNTETAKKSVVFDVRLYRDAVKGKWNKFISTTDKQVVLGKATHDPDELRAMKTLAILDAERVAKSQVSTLPSIDIPNFRTDLEFFQFAHQVLRSGDAPKIKAFLYRTLSPDFFVNGSTVLLNERGEELVKSIATRASNPKISYAQQYAADPKVKHYQLGMIQFWNAQEPIFTRMALGAFGGRYENGVKTGEEMKLTDITIGVVSKADDIARLKSFSSEGLQADASKSKTLSQQLAQSKGEIAAANIAAVAAKTEWSPHTSNKARLRISFPGTPTEEVGQMNDKYPMWTLEAKNNVVLCRAVSIIYPVQLNRMQSKAVVESTIEVLAKNNKAAIASKSEYASGSYGQSFVLDTGDSLIKGRAIVVGDVLYQLLISSDKASWAGLSESSFFNSFAALK